MRRNQLIVVSASFVFLATCLHADCSKDQDHRSNKNSGVWIADFIIAGTQTLSSDDLSAITNQMIGACFDDNSEEIGERVKGLFLDRGYFGATLNDLHIKVNDPVAVPKPVAIEAEVLEGPRYRLAAIGFVGNHAFTTAELTSKFSLKKGDLFSRNKIASGLENVRKLYLSSGFIDIFFIPDTQNVSNATVILSVNVTEGPQYHMGKLEIFAKKEFADRLRTVWELPEGAVFNYAYIDKYLGSNIALLPPDFNREGVQRVRNCREATVEVRLALDPGDPRSLSRPKDIDCDSPDDSPK